MLTRYYISGLLQLTSQVYSTRWSCQICGLRHTITVLESFNQQPPLGSNFTIP